MGSPATVSVRAARGVLLAGYHQAAILSSCFIQRTDETLNNNLASFSAQIVERNSFWAGKATHFSCMMSQKASWVWPIQGMTIREQTVEGVLLGDPVIVLGGMA
jgi:hypothetical protein